MPPHGPDAGPKPYAASVRSRVVEHFAVRPREHSGQSPQDTAHGTTTIWPTLRPVAALPSATICATHSWPMPNGPWNGIRPQIVPTTGSTSPVRIPTCMARDTLRWIGSVSPSHRPAMNGLTIASRGSSNRGAGRSRHSISPAFTNCNSRTWSRLTMCAACR